MKPYLHSEKTLDIIKRLNLARIGEYEKWENIIKKINNGKKLTEDEYLYISNLSRTYKEGHVSNRTRIYHVRLSKADEKPPCNICGNESLFYCNMNDEYFCSIHVVGHDQNEL